MVNTQWLIKMMKQIALIKYARLLVQPINHQTGCYSSRAATTKLQISSPTLTKIHECQTNSQNRLNRYSTNASQNNNLATEKSNVPDRDPMRKPSVEQLVMVEEKMKAHVIT